MISDYQEVKHIIFRHRFKDPLYIVIGCNQSNLPVDENEFISLNEKAVPQ